MKRNLVALADGYNVIKADGSSAKLIRELFKKDNILAMLTLRSSDIDNIYFILNAKSVHKESIVLSRINDAYLLPQYNATGVNEVIEPYSVVDSKTLQYVKTHSAKSGSIIIFGYSHKSQELCKILRKDGVSVTIYEYAQEHYKKAVEDGFKNVYHIDFEQTNYLDDVRLMEEDMILCAMDNESLNVYHSISLKSHGFEGKIVALSDTKEDNRKLILAGVDKIFDMYEESANLFTEMIEKHTEEVK